MSNIRFKNALRMVAILLFGGALLLSFAPNALADDAPAKSSGILPLPDIGFAQARSLEGKWVRQDGGYRLVIEDVKPDGSLKASYYNPKKINVSISNWKVDNDSVHIFVELQDVNYQGSKYNLIYINEKDVFEGTYFLAAQKKTFSIKFLRIPEGQN